MPEHTMTNDVTYFKPVILNSAYILETLGEFLTSTDAWVASSNILFNCCWAEPRHLFLKNIFLCESNAQPKLKNIALNIPQRLVNSLVEWNDHPD